MPALLALLTATLTLLALRLAAVLSGLARLPLLALLALLLLTLVRPVLQFTEGLVREILLIAQRIGQILHRLLAGRARPVAAFAALRHPQILQQLVQLLHQLLRFGHPAFFHQLLNAVHQGLQLVHREFHRILGHIRLIRAALIGLGLLGEHPHVIIGGVAQFLHQLGDFLVRGTVAHRLGEPFLRAAQPLARIGQRAVLQLHRQIPHRQRQLVLHLVGQPDHLQRIQPPDDRPQPQIGRLV